MVKRLLLGPAIAAGCMTIAAAQASLPTVTDTPSPDLAEETPVSAVDRVRLSEDGQDRLTIPVSIGDHGPFDFLIDTGAQGTIVSNRLASRLDLKRAGSATVVSTASSEKVDLVWLDTVSFANRSYRQMRAPVLQHDNLGVDGILGLDALQDLRVLIDFRNGQMDVVDSRVEETGSYDIVVRARRQKGQMIIADAEIDGVETAVIIDTGAQSSIGNPALFRALRARERELASGTDVLGATYEGRVAYVRQMDIGRLRLSDLPIAFVDSPAFGSLGYGDRPALLLGVGNLRRLNRLAIDFRKRQVLFDVASQRMPSF